MITYKQLTLAEIFEDFQNKFDKTNTSSFHFLAKPLTLMKLFLPLLFPIFMPLLEDPVSISFILCLKHF